MRARAWARDNGLSLFFLVLFLVTLAGQAMAGWRQYNAEARAHGEATISFTSFLTSSQFG